MTTASAALQSLDAHRKVVENESAQMKDDLALLRDLRRRYTQPLSELPPCRGLPAPVAHSARKFLVDTEAYIMRRMSAAQGQAAEISNQAEQLRDQIQQTASIAHAIAGTQPAGNFQMPSGGQIGPVSTSQQNANWAAAAAAGGGGGGGSNLNTSGVSNIQTPSMPPAINFQDPLRGAGGGGHNRNSGAGGAGASNFGSPYPNQPLGGGGGGGGGEIRFEAPMGVLPYMTAASAAYRQQQALAYLAADQGVLPRGWAPAGQNPAPLIPHGANNFGANPNYSAGAVGGLGGGGGGAGGLNVSPSRRMANEMSHGDTTFVVLPRASSTEPPKRKGSAKRRQ